MGQTRGAISFAIVLTAVSVQGGAQGRDAAQAPQPGELQAYLQQAQGVSHPTSTLLDAIVEGLHSDEVATRRAAMGAMGAVVRAISTADTNPADIQRVQTHDGLQRSLLEATRAADPMTRTTAVSYLGSPAVRQSSHLNDVWMQLAGSDPEPRVREQAVYQLGKFGAGNAIVAAAVTSALRDPEARVQKQAALAVAKLHPPAAVPILVAELEAGVDEARFEFAYALLSYEDQARQHLPLLRAVTARESRRPEREALERALQHLGQ